MALFTDAVSGLLNTQNIQQSLSALKPDQIAQIVQTGIVDEVTISDDAKNYFSIYQNDVFLDASFSIPDTLDTTQQTQLLQLQQDMQLFLPQSGTGYTNFLDNYLTDFAKSILEQESDETKKEALQNALDQYTLMQSFNQLFGEGSSDIFTQLGNTNLSSVLVPLLSDEEQETLGKVALQTNRLFFQSEDQNFMNNLDLFNQLYGLNTPDEETLTEASKVLQSRSASLAQLLQNRTFSDYNDFFALSSAS